MNIYQKLFENLAALCGDLSVFCKFDDDNKNYHKKIVNEPYMPLVLEYIGHHDILKKPQISMVHYGEQNGDLMRDPEMIFMVDFEKKTAEAVSYRNDYAGYFEEVFVLTKNQVYYSSSQRISQNQFALTWFENLKAQGFIK